MAEIASCLQGSYYEKTSNTVSSSLGKRLSELLGALNPSLSTRQRLLLQARSRAALLLFSAAANIAAHVQGVWRLLLRRPVFRQALLENLVQAVFQGRVDPGVLRGVIALACPSQARSLASRIRTRLIPNYPLQHRNSKHEVYVQDTAELFNRFLDALVTFCGAFYGAYLEHFNKS